PTWRWRPGPKTCWQRLTVCTARSKAEVRAAVRAITAMHTRRYWVSYGPAICASSAFLVVHAAARTAKVIYVVALLCGEHRVQCFSATPSVAQSLHKQKHVNVSL